MAEESKGKRALVPRDEMEQMMDRMERYFEGFMPHRWRWGRLPAPLGEMERMMEQAFEQTFGPGWMRPWQRAGSSLRSLAAPEGQMPRVDVVDRDEDVLIRAELPGVKKEDVDLSMTDDRVTIRATVSREEAEEKGDYYHRELSRGMFSRTVPLPCAVQGDKAKATFKDGVMELLLPKVEASKRQRIKVE
ncbi:MAG: Hsp20/alpha crystallin family protein [Gammaproteobacteria bacterium]